MKNKWLLLLIGIGMAIVVGFLSKFTFYSTGEGENMAMHNWLGLTVAAILTLGIFTFLYKDNPFYKFAEHLLVGSSAGYYLVIYFHNFVRPNLIDAVVNGFKKVGEMQAAGTYSFVDSILKNGGIWAIIPGVMGFLILFRLSRKLGWLSRYSIGFYMGTAMGIAIPVTFQASIIEQVRGTILQTATTTPTPVFNLNFFAPFITDPSWSAFVLAVSGPLVIIGIFCTLIYFFFSKEHTGVVGVFSKIGIWFLMLGFGASFGATVMARISLLIGRMDFLINDWIKGVILPLFGG